ncbi:hypothetical protein A2X44_01795 [candidate division CPR3 bacterium GWF2_35_18]|uniref:Probable transcriptional regulatory protein UR67_C0002G0043 n=1 Tax=candidate division CPR3 bacterium GW2011_GWF2_35_18 TaxID=1618350 RepID=A0A0G0BKF6_UNCC3|nr:MAG: transcriptional regulator [candidate division CPR3 bacterium GW2011_GWF2_35_18]KKP86106.1 MAG: transcriptional regulator [candidate division CPR3 bacterium GW2011_GWE2_35_7]OGB62732.1 MAG: hypothetical protein A2X44_01795 [candidate division CPR3 bacterium GWF2_35_18]OGB65758.1 MAG: hypothetical protein A2250_02055 [candidate division CPR3 bacterium RIFOXYA2_FULL_35_13]OGB76486.1 MAG: hypothetical protein A2476_03345 [candidate division CPR3 bacterium RIFOXYC2_FULL_35_7]OGB79249.1 MAG:
MSGHSKWKTNKHKKGIADAKRGQAFTKIAKIITIAAKEGGGNPDSNFKLRLAIEKGREVNMPKENVQRAIDRGVGNADGASNYKEVVYEGFGPEGTAFIVDAATDNTNRTNAELKTLFSKNGGNMASSGAVAYLFDHVGYLFLEIEKNKIEEVMLTVMEEAGVLDVVEDKEGIDVYTQLDMLSAIRESLTAKGYNIKDGELIFRAKNPIKIEDKNIIERLISFSELIEEHDDVQKVHVNFEIDDEIFK